jgi:MFS transporter, DHA1 family, multidrug resistance protein
MDELTAGEAKKITVPSYPVLLFTCCAVAAVCYFSSFMRIPVIPLYARSFGADAFQVGLINAAFLLMAGIVSLPLGILSDRLGRKLLIITGLALAAGSSFLLSLCTNDLYQ